MYMNYGDKNFFQHGRLIKQGSGEHIFNIIYCEPFPTEEDRYLFCILYIDISDTWIEKEKVLSFIGLNKVETKEEKILYALACVDYYGIDNFINTEMSFTDKKEFTQFEILDLLSYYHLPNDFEIDLPF